VGEHPTPCPKKKGHLKRVGPNLLWPKGKISPQLLERRLPKRKRAPQRRKFSQRKRKKG